MAKNRFDQPRSSRGRWRLNFFLTLGFIIAILIASGFITHGQYWGTRNAIRHWICKSFCKHCQIKTGLSQEEVVKLKMSNKKLLKNNDSLQNIIDAEKPCPVLFIDSAIIARQYLAKNSQPKEKVVIVHKKQEHQNVSCCHIVRKKVYRPHKRSCCTGPSIFDQ
jgi:hypothetical protein